MKFELSHDILAKKVYEKSSQEDKMLRKAEAFVKERHAYYLVQGVMLGKQDLEYIAPHLNNINLTKEENKFINKSRKRVVRSEGRKVINNFLFIMLPILLGLLIWAGYQTLETNKALDAAKKAEGIAAKNEKEAKNSAILAKKAEQEAKNSEEEARGALQKATIQEQRTIQALQEARIQEQRAFEALKEAEKSATEAGIQKQKAIKAEKEARNAEQEARTSAKKASKNEKKALEIAKEAKTLQKEADQLRKKAEEETARAKALAEKAAKQQKIARALYLASLADNALRLRKGIIAYNLAKLSWEMDKNLMAQKVLFDCQNAYLAEPIIFDKYQGKGVKNYMEQTNIRIDQQMQQQNIKRFGIKFRNRISIDGNFQKLVFSPNKKLLATFFFKKKTVRIINVENGKTIARIKAAANVRAIRFSANNNYILFVLANNSSELRSTKGKLINTLLHFTEIVSAQFSTEGKNTFIATVEENKIGKLWNEEGTLLKEFKVNLVDSNVQPHSDGQNILMLEKDKTPSLLNVFTNQKIIYQDRIKGDKTPLLKQIEAQFSPNGHYVMTTTKSGLINLWKKDGTKKTTITVKGNIGFAKFSPSGKEIITTSSSSRFAELWSLNGKALGKFYYDGNDPINSVEFSDDGLRVLIGRSKIANLWGIKGRLLYSFDANQSIVSANFSNDNKSVLIATYEGILDKWNIVRPEEIIDYYDNSANIRPLTKEEKLEYEIVNSDFN